MKLFTILIFSFILAYTGCKDKDDKVKSETTCKNAKKAKIVDMTGLDGCGLMLQLDDETRLEPTNFNKFEEKVPLVDGTKVWVEYKPADGFASICMAGQLVEIYCLEKMK